MRTIYTKDELASALKKGEIVKVRGSLANEFKKNNEAKGKAKKRKRSMKGGLLVAALGLVATPFTFGSSLGVAGTSLLGTMGAVALTAGGITLTTADLAIILGATLGAYGIHKGAKVKFCSDGSVTVEPV